MRSSATTAGDSRDTAAGDPPELNSGARSAPSLQLERLTQLSRAFTYATSLAEILELAVKQAAEMLAADKAILLLADDTGVLHVSASHGVSAELVSRFRESLDESLPSRLEGLAGTPLSEGFVGVPLVSNGNVIGLLAVLRPDTGLPTADEEWLLSALADQVAAPLENARLAEQLERVALISENGRLYEAERTARKEAELAREEAEAARLQADLARQQAELARQEAEIARDLAQESNRSKAAFLAAMSHDLRTPLNAIGGYVQLLKMGLRGPVTEDQTADLDRIARNQTHLLSIISQVLEFARIGAGRISYTQTDVSLEAEIRDAEAMVMPQLLAKGIEYRCNGADHPITFRTDAGKLQQILLNLLSNAIKFTPEGGRITTSYRARTDGAFANKPIVEISVSDTGPGIAEDRLDSVFLPFVQIDRALNHPDDGIGLGLAISRDLAQGLGGDVTVVSEYGKGASFTLTLPLR